MRKIAGTMAAMIRHRGPDGEQSWADPDAGIAFGFRRLAIIDLTPTGNQPMRSADGRVVLMQNGELYNYQALRGELEQSDSIAWRGTSDTEVLVEAIARWGLEPTLKKANGMFALAVWDRKARTLSLARDRLGETALLWLVGHYVSSSAPSFKALAAHPAWDRADQSRRRGFVTAIQLRAWPAHHFRRHPQAAARANGDLGG